MPHNGLRVCKNKFIMKIKYNIETVDKSINTTAVEIVAEERTFNQMWREADKKLKSSINRFYENFIKNK